MSNDSFHASDRLDPCNNSQFHKLESFAMVYIIKTIGLGSKHSTLPPVFDALYPAIYSRHLQCNELLATCKTGESRILPINHNNTEVASGIIYLNIRIYS